MKPETDNKRNLKPNLKEIKARCEAATKGPWVVEEEGFFEVWNSPQLNMIARLSPKDHFSLGKTSCYRNSKFIANARQDIPDLLKYIEELESKLDQERRQIGLEIRSYLDLKKELEQVKDSHRRQGQLNDALSENFKKALEVIKYYANPKNMADSAYEFGDGDYMGYVDIEDFSKCSWKDCSGNEYSSMHYGKAARKFLEDNK